MRHNYRRTVRSLWTWLWGRYNVPQNVFLVLYNLRLPMKITVIVILNKIYSQITKSSSEQLYYTERSIFHDIKIKCKKYLVEALRTLQIVQLYITRCTTLETNEKNSSWKQLYWATHWTFDHYYITYRVTMLLKWCNNFMSCISCPAFSCLATWSVIFSATVNSNIPLLSFSNCVSL